MTLRSRSGLIQGKLARPIYERRLPRWGIVPCRADVIQRMCSTRCGVVPSARFRFIAVRVFPALALFFLLSSKTHAKDSPRPADSPLFWQIPVALSPQCHFLGDCAKFDALALKAGLVSWVRGTGDKSFAALSGLVHASISFFDIAELGGAFGGHLTHDEAAAFHDASMPGRLYAKLRLWPMPWRQRAASGTPELAVAYERSFTAEKLGKDEPPGFDTNTLSLLLSRAFGPMDLDVSVGALWGTGQPELRRAVRITGSAAVRLFGLAKSLTPDEQLRVMVQAAYRFSLPGDSTPADAYLLGGVEEVTHSGYRFGLAVGPYVLGSRVGGLGMFTFSAAWGARYRNPLAESLASQPPWIPKVWMDLFHVDPVLEKDGCILTDPAAYRMRIKCVGHPDPKDPNTIILDDGRRLAAGTHLWIRDDGMLITQRQEEVAQLDADRAKKAILVQQMVSYLRSSGDKTKPCRLAHAVLEEAARSNVFALATTLEAAPGLMMADWLNAFQACGLLGSAMSGGILPPIGRLGTRSGMGHMPAFSGKAGQQGEAEHAPPVAPIHIGLDDKTRSHVFYGDINKNKSTGWHYEPSADPKKGTYVIEETRSVPDKYGVYEANVVIEGIKKGPRSTFFPKDWSAAQVEQAIVETYQNGKPDPHRPWLIKGTTNRGVEIQLELKGGQIQSAYPLYKGER